MRRPVLLAAVLLLAGCLEFDEQEIRVAYDAEHDRIDAQLVYRGLASDESGQESWLFSPPAPTNREGTLQQLDLLLSGRPLFALFHSLATFDLVELRASDDVRIVELAKLAAVDRGDFFRGEDGRICGWQHLCIRNVTRVVEMWDAMLRDKLADESEQKQLRAALCCEDSVSTAFWNDALAKQKRWLERNGDELLWHIPASATAARALATRIETAPAPEALVMAFAKQESDTDGASAKVVETPASPKAGTTETKGAAGRRAMEVIPSKTIWLTTLLHAIGATVRLRDGGADLVLWDAARAPQIVRIKQPPAKIARRDLAPCLEMRKVVLRTDVTDAVLSADFAERRK